jgi:rhodanese-related sulfurtransferase
MKRSQVYKPIFALVLMFVMLLLVACGGQESVDTAPTVTDLSSQIQIIPVEGGGSYTDVSADGLALMLENKDFPLINVHIPYAGEIEGTDEFIPFNQIEQNTEKLPADKDARLVIYCRSGGMSGISARTLVELGYTDVWNLDGGMIAWEASGRPLVNS